jgi:hypothetical protein
MVVTCAFDFDLARDFYQVSYHISGMEYVQDLSRNFIIAIFLLLLLPHSKDSFTHKQPMQQHFVVFLLFKPYMYMETLNHA